MEAIVLGATGLVGAEVLKCLEKSSVFGKVNTISRRAPKSNDPKIAKIVEEDTDKWYDAIQSMTGAKVYISSFGTTRAAAGSADNFVKIDYGINYESAKAAKKAGVETCVLVSSIGVNPKSPFLYMSTKGKLEDDIVALEFPRTIILRPGVLLGQREKSKGLRDTLAVSVLKYTRNNFLSYITHPTYGDEVAKAAVKAAEEPLTKNDKPQVSILEADDIIKSAGN